MDNFRMITLTFLLLVPSVFSARLERSHVRLVNGGADWEGRVEVFRDKEWGTVCDDSFTKEAAEVICRMLGFSTERARMAPPETFGQGRGPIWIDNLRCTGAEVDIALCDMNEWGVHNCDHNEDIGITCPPNSGNVPRLSSIERNPPSGLSSETKEDVDTLLDGPGDPFGGLDSDPHPPIPSPGIAGIEHTPGPPSFELGSICSGHGQQTCSCDQGYRGANCEIEIDWCNEPVENYMGGSYIKMGDLCRPNGNCTSSPKGIQCHCNPRFSGPFCQEEDRSDRWESKRCGLYDTPLISQKNIQTFCPQTDESNQLLRQHCIPDNLDCFYLNCDFPVGWCLPTSEENYLKLRKSSGRRL